MIKMTKTKTRLVQPVFLGASSICLFASTALGVLVTDPDDPRSWQGATVGTFAELYFGSDTDANRQSVVDNGLLDDGLFDFTDSTAATLVHNAWSDAPGSGGVIGRSTDTTGTGSFEFENAGDLFSNANTIDTDWFQSSATIGDTVFDLGGPATKAAIFNTIDHGPLPQEAIESTVYLSENPAGPWTQAVVERVWLEGFESNLGILWDGFVYAVGTGTSDTFEYASITWGGPGALIRDGDDEINGVLGLDADFRPTPTPTPDGGSSVVLLGLALAALVGLNKKTKAS